jgi:hypothetical protein
MPLQSPSLRRFVTRALLDTMGAGEPDRTRLASAFNTLAQQLRDRLKPLFGLTAVDALFVRSVHVASAEHRWLGALLANGRDLTSVDQVASFNNLDLNTLRDGLVAVLAYNIGLLSAFVGEDFVMPLVQQAWGISNPSGNEGAP